MSTPRRASIQIRTVPQLLAVAVLVRMVVDTGTQLFGPFLATFARGLGVDLITLGQMVSLRSFAGITAPLFGSTADRIGYRRVLRLALALAGLGMWLIALSPGRLWLLALGMVCAGAGLAGFVPTLQAYVSAQLPYQNRARGIGTLEYAWALSGILGLSTMGWLIQRVGWQAPFWVLGGGLLLGAGLFGFLPPTDRTRRPDSTPARPWHGRLAGLFHFPQRAARVVYANIAVTTLMFFAQVHILIIHGGWLELEYGLQPQALGLVALAQGLADLCGSVTASLITDRIGKRRAVMAGLSGATLAYILLPFLNVGLLPAVLALLLTRICFEFSVVSNLSLLSEHVPSARGRVMSLNAAFVLLALTVTGVSGPWAYTRFGVWGLGPVSALSGLVGVLILALAVPEPGRHLQTLAEPDETVRLPSADGL